MSVWLAWMNGVVAVALWLAWRRRGNTLITERCLHEARVGEPTTTASDATRLRARLRRARRHARRSDQLKRRSQRVVAMARMVAGCRTHEEAAARATRAIVDGFGARGAAVWSLDKPPVLLAFAGREIGVGDTAAPDAAGAGIEIKLRDEERRPVGTLLVTLDGRTRPPAGLPAYAAVLGAVMGAGRNVADPAHGTHPDQTLPDAAMALPAVTETALA